MICFPLQDNDDFVLTALLCAAEDGDLASIKKLCNLASIDVNKENKVRRRYIVMRKTMECF